MNGNKEVKNNSRKVPYADPTARLFDQDRSSRL